MSMSLPPPPPHQKHWVALYWRRPVWWGKKNIALEAVQESKQAGRKPHTAVQHYSVYTWGCKAHFFLGEEKIVFPSSHVRWVGGIGEGGD